MKPITEGGAWLNSLTQCVCVDTQEGELEERSGWVSATPPAQPSWDHITAGFTELNGDDNIQHTALCECYIYVCEITTTNVAP